MKTKNFFLAGLLTFASTMFAQGNMQFNQIKRLAYSGTVSSYFNSNGDPVTLASVSVPAGKVWKIESGSIFGSWSNSGVKMLTSDMALFVDNQIVYLGESSYSSAMQRNSSTSAPIWLGPGTYSFSYYCGNSLASSYKAVISAIEFNIVQ